MSRARHYADLLRCTVLRPADLKDQWRIQKNKQLPYDRIHVMIEEIQGTVCGNFGSQLNLIWGVGDGLERKCSRQREKGVGPGAKRM